MNNYHPQKTSNKHAIEAAPDMKSIANTSQSNGEPTTISGEVAKIGSDLTSTIKNEAKATLPNMLRQILGQPTLHIDRDPQKLQKEQEYWKQRYQMKELQHQAEVTSLKQKQAEQEQKIVAIREQLNQATQSVGKLAQEIEIAAFKAPEQGTIYYENLLLHLLKQVGNIGKRLNAAQWLAERNRRGQKQAFKNQGVLSVAKQGKNLKSNVYQSQERAISFQG